MKLGIISDVHSNFYAFQKVLQELRERVDKIIHAGDIVGYNAHPNEVVEIFRNENILSIMGNHDYATVSGDTSWFNEVATAAIEWTRKVLTSENLAFLRTLSLRENIELENLRIAIVHGSPYNDFDYVYQDDVRDDFLKVVSADILILGHTHIPYIKKFDEGLILNPGAVGQPRDGDWRASYMILDLNSRIAALHRVAYDIEETVSALYENNLPIFLASRLRRGI